MFFVSYKLLSAKFFILNLKGFIEKNSYERRVYDSVDDGSLSEVKSQKEVKQFMPLSVKY